MQVGAADGVIQIEEPAVWQCLAPRQLVVVPESRTVHVRILSARVGPKIKRGIDHPAPRMYVTRSGRLGRVLGAWEAARAGCRGIARLHSCSTMVDTDDRRTDAGPLER